MEAKIFLLLLIVTIEIVSGCSKCRTEDPEECKKQSDSNKDRDQRRKEGRWKSCCETVRGEHYDYCPSGCLKSCCETGPGERYHYCPTICHAISQEEMFKYPYRYNHHYPKPKGPPKPRFHHYPKPKGPPKPEPTPEGDMRGGDAVEIPLTTTLKPMSNPVLNEAVQMAMLRSIGGPLQVSEVALVNQPRDQIAPKDPIMNGSILSETKTSRVQQVFGPEEDPTQDTNLNGTGQSFRQIVPPPPCCKATTLPDCRTCSPSAPECC